MPNTILGKATIIPKGAYSALVEYARLNLVTDSGNSYLYINSTPAAGVSVTDTSHWQQIASRGMTGPSAYDAAVAGGYMGTEADFNAANAGIEAAVEGANDASETANEAAENAETAAYRSMLWRKTPSGNPVPVYPVPESPLYTKVSGTFTQAGAGDPSPENIRQITPWLASGGTVKIKRTGKNLFAENLVLVATTSWRTKDSAVYKVDSNKPTYIQVNLDELSRFYVYLYDNAMQPITLYHGEVFDVNSYIGKRSSNEDYSGLLSLIDDAFYGNAANIKESKIVLKTMPSAGVGYVKLQINSGSDTTPRTITASNVLISNESDVYEPYTEQEITLTAPQEIPAGWMDNEGNGQITHGYIASYVDETVPDGWVSSIGELSAGAQVVYPLATPIDITPTSAPLISIPQLDSITPRQNVLTASTGNVELTYAKSPIREADELAAAIAALP